jgi:hypothetical protein
MNTSSLGWKLIKIVLIVIILLLISACNPATRSEQAAYPDVVFLSANSTVGQSFVSRYDGLSSIDVFLKPTQDLPGEITLSLYELSTLQEPVRTAVLPGSSITRNGFYQFDFEPMAESAGEDFFFELSISETGRVRIGSGPGEIYLSGAQYIDGSTQDSQSTFRLSYDRFPMLSGLFFESLWWLVLLLLAAIMFAVPGWAALSWFFPPWVTYHWISRLCLSIGIGMAFYPVLLLWMDMVGVHSNLINVALLPLLGIVLILLRHTRQNRDWKNIFRISTKRSQETDALSAQPGKRIFWGGLLPDLAFLVLISIIFFTRMWPVRLLDAPMWGDSYQHTMIAQLLADNGGLFTSWEPYAQLESLTYHFGFHSLVSNFHWLSGLNIVQSTLWMGQILNLFAITALYPLALMISKNKWDGLIAVLVAGLLSSMPMYYVNWGRYTQLAGQVILPAILVIIWENLDIKEQNFKWYSLIWLGLAGLALTHYRVTIFIPLFFIAYLLFYVWKPQPGRLLIKMSLHAFGVVILLIPWGIRIFEGTLPRIFRSQVSTAAANVSQATQELNTIGSLTNYLPTVLWVLGLLAVVWGIWSRNQKINIFSLWWFLILLAANPSWLRLPGTGVLTNFAVFIAAYLPASILVGAISASLLSKIGMRDPLLDVDQEKQPGHRKNLVSISLLLIILVVVSLGFIRPRISDVQPAQHALLTRPDLRAVQWIDKNLPKEANFLVNSFFAYGGTLVVGSDGGWWLPLLTSRGSTQPPLTYGSERGPFPNFITYTNDLVALIESKGISHPEVLSEFHQRGITHVFIGQQQGQVNAPGPPLLNAQLLIDDPRFSLVYNEDRVWIFEIAQG